MNNDTKLAVIVIIAAALVLCWIIDSIISSIRSLDRKINPGKRQLDANATITNISVKVSKYRKASDRMLHYVHFSDGFIFRAANVAHPMELTHMAYAAHSEAVFEQSIDYLPIYKKIAKKVVYLLKK